MTDTTAQDQVISNAQAATITQALYSAETSSIRNTEYPTSVDKDRDMLDSRAAYETAMSLLMSEQNDQPYSDQGREQVRAQAWQVARASLQQGITNIKNMRLRAQYFQKVADTVGEFRSQVGTASLSELDELAREAMEIRDAQMELYRAQLSQTGQFFKDWMQGKTLIDLQRIYTAKRFPGTDFSALSQENKLLVYGDIIEASGRSTAFSTLVSDSKQYLVKGGPFILLTIGITVWQISNDAHPMTTIVENAVNVAAGLEGTEAGATIGAAIGAAGGPVGLFLGGLIGGIIGGFAAGWAADNLFDATVGAFSGRTTGPANQPLFVKPYRYQFAVPDNFKLTQSLLSQVGHG
jgi:hypothetical protein